MATTSGARARSHLAHRRRSLALQWQTPPRSAAQRAVAIFERRRRRHRRRRGRRRRRRRLR